MELTMNTVNQVPKGTVLYVQGNTVGSVSLVVKGRVLVYNQGTKIICGPGSFLGVSDLASGVFSVSYYVAEDAQIFPVSASNMDQFEAILENKPDYRVSVVSALSRQIVELYKVYVALEKCATSLHNFIETAYEEYVEIAKKNSMTIAKKPESESLPQVEAGEDLQDARYYIECATLPTEVQKAYYSHGSQIAVKHFEEQIQIVGNLLQGCEELSGYIHRLFQCVYGAESSCIFEIVAQMALEMKKSKLDAKLAVKLLTEVNNKTAEVENCILTKTGKKLAFDKEKMGQVYTLVMEDAKVQEEQDDEISVETAVKYAGVDTDTIEKELQGSMAKILAYSQLPEETCSKFQQYVLAFMNMHDKAAADDDARKLRKNLANSFYEVYEAVFLRDYKEKSNQRLIDLFLLYGFADERLVSKEQMIQLYCLEDQDDGQGPCKVYNIKQWLTAVLNGEKEPSKSEFDMDYYETLREMKKTGQIKEEDMEAAKHDNMRKFSYEVANMFRYNSRIVSGQVSIFVPILYKEMFMGHIDQSYMTTNKVNEIIKKIVSVDYSLFYRESMQNDPARNIEKEYIQEEVYPDIILMPTYGSNGAMWQEIEGRKRATPGRFLFPSFAETDMEEVFIRVCGRFRWELCRTIQGVTWNDVKYKSLTSEYVDYIQFYRKNRALSEEKREKIKLQIQKGRGNTREIFVIDYILWVKNESAGSLRLNKVAREVLASYCPFVKEIRAKVQTQPLFEEAMAKFNRERQKKVKELDLRYRSLETKGIQITPEMEATMKFYRDM